MMKRKYPKMASNGDNILSRLEEIPWDTALIRALGIMIFFVIVWGVVTILLWGLVTTNNLSVFYAISKIVFFVLFILYAGYVSYSLRRRNIFYILAALLAFLSYIDGQSRYFTPIQYFMEWIAWNTNLQQELETFRTLIDNAFSEGIVVWIGIDTVFQSISNKRDEQWKHYVLVLYHTIVNQINYLKSVEQLDAIKIIGNNLNTDELESYCRMKLNSRLKEIDAVYYNGLLIGLEKLHCDKAGICAKEYLVASHNVKELLEKSEFFY